jgi:hypothetical protein
VLQKDSSTWLAGLMERGDYDAVEDLLFFLGSGVPY